MMPAYIVIHCGQCNQSIGRLRYQGPGDFETLADILYTAHASECPVRPPEYGVEAAKARVQRDVLVRQGVVILP